MRNQTISDIRSPRGRVSAEQRVFARRSKQSTRMPTSTRTKVGRKHPGHHNSKERTMSDLKESTTSSSEAKAAPTVDLKLEIVVIPVSDVERAKQFYAMLGWRLDADFAGADD